MTLRKMTEIAGVPLRGGSTTVREPNLLPSGSFSMVQNYRPKRPGFIKRRGSRKMHDTADSTNSALTIYQFKKTRNSTENHYIAQMSDGDLLLATTAPPGVTAGAFGSELADLTTAPIKASWANLNDIIQFSNGVDQHKLWAGTTSKVDKFVVLKATANPTTSYGVIESGIDYSFQINDDSVASVAILNDLDIAANGDGFYIGVPVPAKSFTFDLINFNTNVSTLTGYYFKNDFTWISLGIADGTDTLAGGHTTLGQDGTITFSAPATIQPKYMFGKFCYWYLFVVSAALDAAVSIASVTYDTDFSSLVNMWDGNPIPAVEVLVEGTSTFDNYGSSSVELDLLTSGKKIYIAASTKIEAIYVNSGETPNATGDSIASLKYWDGTAFTSVGTPVDGTTGLSQPGWISFPRKDAFPIQFESSQYHAYWYELIMSGDISADVVVAIYVQPYYDISELGSVGQCNTVWKERGVWSFTNRFQEYIYISQTDAPQILNGSDFTILEMGDGRPNKVVSMKKMYNELLVAQEEKGVEGGCLTLIQGYNPATFGKLVLSTRVGSMNADSMEVVENVYVSTASTETLRTVAFGLSRYGVWACDGKAISLISDDIQNYFDPQDSNCIRRGYESKMWLKHDPIWNVLRLGLVCGSSATMPNVFPVYDLTDRVWYFDTYAVNYSCLVPVEPGSGDVPIMMLAGGVGNGFIYQDDYGTNDVSTAVSSYIQVELNGAGQWMQLVKLLLATKTQSAGTVTVTTYQNGVQKDSFTLSQVAEVTNQTVRRHLKTLNVKSPNMSVKIAHATASESNYLELIGMEVGLWEKR